MTNAQIKEWCEDEGIDFKAHTQWHIHLHDTLLKTEVDIWHGRRITYHIYGTNEYPRHYGSMKDLLHKLFIVPAEAENAKL